MYIASIVLESNKYKNNNKIEYCRHVTTPHSLLWFNGHFQRYHIEIPECERTATTIGMCVLEMVKLKCCCWPLFDELHNLHAKCDDNVTAIANTHTHTQDFHPYHLQVLSK